MSGADIVDSKLRAAVRGAQNQGIRCVKVSVVDAPLAAGAPAQRVLSLTSSFKEEPGQSLEREFMRCVTKQVEPKKSVLFLFRTDENENIAGARWLLVGWAPADGTDLDRALHMRSRGMLAKLVSQPYFLSELLVKEHKQLTWAIARETAGAMVGGGIGRSIGKGGPPDTIVQPQMPEDKQRFFLFPGSIKAIAPQSAPVKLTVKCLAKLQRLVRKEDRCLRLSFLKEEAGLAHAHGHAHTYIQRTPQLDAQTVDCNSPANLAECVLPTSDCYFAMVVKNSLLFVLWCPENQQKDVFRVTDDTRHAALKSSIADLALRGFPEPKPRLVSVDARDPQDIVDGASGLPVGSSSSRRSSVRPAEVDISNAITGDCFGLRGPFPPQRSPTATIPSTLLLPERPIPPWRGGTKAHTIGSGVSKNKLGLEGAVVAAKTGHR